MRLFGEFVHLFALILWAAAALAFMADYLHPGEGMGALGVAIVGVIALNGMFSFWQVYQAERAFASLQQLLPRRPPSCGAAWWSNCRRQRWCPATSSTWRPAIASRPTAG